MGCSICSKEKQPKPKIFTVIPSHLVQDSQKSISEIYQIDHLISEGTYGPLFSCTHRVTAQKKLLKNIPKLSVKGTKTRFRFINEISSLKSLQHPNIITLTEFYEDEKNYFLVTDPFPGCEILENIVNSKLITEKNCKIYMKQIFSALDYTHKKETVNRDLRIENIFIEPPDSENIKLVNFGTAVINGVSKQLMLPQTGFSYMAPEVHKGKFDCKSDVWSAGVVMFVLLTGKMPFRTVEELKKGNFVTENRWNSLSNEAKGFISKLLDIVPDKRPNAETALSDLWFSNHSIEEVKIDVLEDLQSLRADLKLKKKIFSYIMNETITQAEEIEFKKLFQSNDTTSSGKIDADELVRVCKVVYGDKKNAEDIRNVFSQIDVNRTGTIEFSLFLQMVKEDSRSWRVARLEEAFRMFEKDAKERVLAKEIKELIGEFGEEALVWSKVIEQLDLCEDGMEMKDFKDLMLGALD